MTYQCPHCQQHHVRVRAVYSALCLGCGGLLTWEEKQDSSTTPFLVVHPAAAESQTSAVCVCVCVCVWKNTQMVST